MNYFAVNLLPRGLRTSTRILRMNVYSKGDPIMRIDDPWLQRKIRRWEKNQGSVIVTRKFTRLRQVFFFLSYLDSLLILTLLVCY